MVEAIGQSLLAPFRSLHGREVSRPAGRQHLQHVHFERDNARNRLLAPKCRSGGLAESES